MVVTWISRLLFVLACGFLFFSASTAATLGLQDLRMIGFIAVFAALLVTSLASRSAFSPRLMELPLVLLWLLGVLAVLDMFGQFDPLDYKILLPILAIGAAPQLRPMLVALDLPRLLYVMLSLHMVVIALFHLAGWPSGETGSTDQRADPTGSVVSLASLGILTATLAFGEFRQSAGARRLVALAVLTVSMTLVLASGTRTALLTLGIIAILSAMAGTGERENSKSVLVPFLIFLSVFAAYTLFVSDLFYLRLIGKNGDDYTSGRLHSLLHWLKIAMDNPFGLGLGGVREIMQDGRPAIGGGRLLEWPHNEFVRFLVEGGIVGLGMILLLVVGMTRRALHFARQTIHPRERLLALTLAADMIAQCLVQNHFNMIYHASITMLVLAVLTVGAERGSPAAGTAVRFARERESGQGGSACRVKTKPPFSTSTCTSDRPISGH